ncbi:hypothetical protein Pfo_010879 [Paulownia fortunei]|nr:hypothetical protein Pfo_010879 [Paulownia fortunei]
MQRQSPPNHRHDGTSPLPLGMDWSLPPRIWAGRETVWPHDPRTGWSYCVTIPSWVVLAKSRDSDPTVFYRVQVGIQSPEGLTTTRTVLRRFNDFLKLHAALKRAFHQKNLPPTPPKGLLRMKTRAMLEERRSSLEEWMTKLLSDIDLSRSIAVASFLELEAAARSSFQEEGQHSSNSHLSANPSVSSLHVHPNSGISAVAGSSSLISDYGSDTAYETSENGTPSLGRDNNSEVGTEDLSLDDDLTSPIEKFVKYGMSNIDEGLSMGQAILEQLEGFPKHKLHAREIQSNLEHNLINGNSSKASHHTADVLKLLSEPDHGTEFHHVQKLSNESIGSDRSSQGGSELSAFPNSNGYGPVDFRSGSEVSRTIGTVGDSVYQLRYDVHLVVPLDQRQKMNRVLTTMQRQLITAKTDMEDLISRLNQEIALKDYLATKVKDLEVELETTKHKSKENLEQAILIERERVTQMQWDMEELRQKSMEMELKLKSQQVQRLNTQSADSLSNQQKDVLHHELDSAKKQFKDLSKRYQEQEVKSKADIKVLVKEVKSLRSSQAELKQQLNQSLKEKSNTEDFLQEERERNEQTRTFWRKLLYKCKILHDQLQKCEVKNLIHQKGDDPPVNISSLSNPLDLVATSDNQIDLLIAEVQHVAQGVDYSASTTDSVTQLDDDVSLVDEELRQMLMRILVYNGSLRKQVNSLIVHGQKMNKSLEKVDIKSNSDVNVQNEL